MGSSGAIFPKFVIIKRSKVKTKIEQIRSRDVLGRRLKNLMKYKDSPTGMAIKQIKV